MVNPDPQKVSALLRACAKDCILPYHGQLKDDHKGYKGGNPLNEVTIADHKSEAFLTYELSKLSPGSFVVGEEACEDDPAILNHLKDNKKTVWVIDPVDGTSNFARGSPTFCVIVALVRDGETQMGWIYDPCSDQMAFAEKGKGAFIDARKLDIDGTGAPESPTGYAGYRYAHQLSNITVRTLRCAGHEYLHIASGDAEFSLYAKMKAWDHLAGVLMVQEAGGYVRKWDGSTYKPCDKVGGLISARNRETWEKIQSLIPDKVLKKHAINK